MNNINETWNKIIKLIKEDMKDAPFNSLILPLEPISIEREKKRFILKVPNQITRDRIEGRYYKTQIRDSICDVLGPGYDFKLLLPEEIKPPKKTVQKEVVASRFNGEPINPKYTFDNFVQGNSNKYASSMAFTVARNPSEVFNPLFIYGGVGLGKTHLICAIGNDIRERMPEMDVMYITAETFVNDYVSSIKDKTQNEFREKYRNVDVLLVDDIQFLAGKDSSQQEFFHTFDALHNGERQIVLTSDKPPKDLHNFADRLVTRFGWSGMVDISPPELETRIAILMKKAQNEGIDITPNLQEGIEYIAEHIQFNVREMEGALTRLLSHSRMENVPITRDYAHRVLKDIIRDNRLNLTPQRIKEAVAEQFNINVEDMESNKRTNNIVYPRRIAMYLCREKAGLPFKRIGDEFGGKDHSTVITSCRSIETAIKINPDLKEVIKEIEEKLKY